MNPTQLFKLQHQQIQEMLKLCKQALKDLNNIGCSCGHIFEDENDYQVVGDKKVCSACVDHNLNQE